MATIISKPGKTAKPKKTSDERKAALDLKTMGKRGQITLCIHGMNENYCKTCMAKKAAKTAKSAKKTKPAEESPAAAE